MSKAKILDEILAYKRKEVEERKSKIPLEALERKIGSKTKGFYKSLTIDKGIKLIAELKKASPSKGVIREDFKPLDLARSCADAGASALSVLTDEKFFKGSLGYLETISKEVAVPVLRKDFIIDEYQITEARVYGADAVLLIANILEEEQMRKFLELSHTYGMDCLVEVHNQEELKNVLNIDPKIIGINNRDLKTFEVDIKTTERLISSVPGGKLIVSESGIFGRKDVEYLEGLGVGAILAGEAIMASPDAGCKVKELLGRG